MYYIEFADGTIIENLTELEMYKTLWEGTYDEDGYKLKVTCYGKMF